MIKISKAIIVTNMWDILVLLLNIFGVLIAYAILSFLWIYYFQKYWEKNLNEVTITTKLKNHLPANCGDNELLPYIYAYYSPELLANRFSDFIYTITTPLMWVVNILITLLFIGTIFYLLYYTAYVDGGSAILWIFIIIELVKYLLIFCLYVLTKLITNRYPGEAKLLRPTIVEYLERNKPHIDPTA